MNEDHAPFYQRLGFTLLSLAIIATAIVLGKEVLLPILFAVLLSMLLLPATNYLAQKKFHRILSIGIPVLLTLIVIGGMIYFLSTQIANFLDDAPELNKKLSEVGLLYKSGSPNTFISLCANKTNTYKKPWRGSRIMGAGW